jgi:adenylosuccinate lyase
VQGFKNMIKKYKISQIETIWSLDEKYSLMERLSLFYIKLLLEDTHTYWQQEKLIILNTPISISRIEYLQNTTKHETVAFLMHLEERLKHPISKNLLHKNLTSSDLLDSASTIQHKLSYNFLNKKLKILKDTIACKIVQNEQLACAGRTHSKHAEKINFTNRLKNLDIAIFEITNFLNFAIIKLPGKLSGPVGNAKNIPFSLRIKFSQEFNLPLSNSQMQIVPRYHYANIVFHLANLASAYEKFATDIRLLAFNEIDEVQEGFDSGQYGSSAMPHKKNPILSERICGLSRYLRQNVSGSIENNVTWLERDISHSSFERVTWENQWHIICYLTIKLNLLINNMQINNANCKKNLQKATFSQSRLNEVLNFNSIARFQAYNKIKGK